jgi:hypothetical protein
VKSPELGAEPVSLYWGLPADLLTRIVVKGEKNKAWKLELVSGKGAVGVAQVRPLTVCQKQKACNAKGPWDQSLLDKIHERLRLEWRYNLCWAGRIMADNWWACLGQSMCASMLYNGGDWSLAYARRVEE